MVENYNLNFPPKSILNQTIFSQPQRKLQHYHQKVNIKNMLMILYIF